MSESVYEIVAIESGEKIISAYLYTPKTAINLVINLRNKNKNIKYYLKKY